VLTSPDLEEYGLAYNGIGTVQTANGPVKVLEFSADKITILSMITYGETGGGKMYSDGGKGLTVTAEGNVTLRVQELKGTLLGLLPQDYTPASPPPLPIGLKLPIPIYFTDVTVVQQLLQTNSLIIPSLTNNFSG
jgi:hypothetical protein